MEKVMHLLLKSPLSGLINAFNVFIPNTLHPLTYQQQKKKEIYIVVIQKDQVLRGTGNS